MFSRADRNFDITSELNGTSLLHLTISCMSSEIPLCLNCYSVNKRVVKDGKKTMSHHVYDLVGNKPAKLTFSKVQQWRCKNCGNRFTDPAMNPYFGKKATTSDFDEYIAQEIISAKGTKSTRQIAAEYGLSESVVRKALHGYLETCRSIMVIRGKYPIVWIMPVTFEHQMRLVVFGEQTGTKKRVLIGIAERASMDAVLALLPYGESEPEQVFIRPDEIKHLIDKSPFIFRSMDTIPGEFIRVIEIIERLRSNRVRFETLLLLIPFYDKLRRSLVIKSGNAPFLDGNTVSFMEPLRDLHSSHSVCQTDYRYIDIDAILATYG